MKYYIYISDNKLDMLFPQVSTEIKEKIASEWKLDFKVFSVSRKSETEMPTNRYARLQAVADFIHKYGDVGSVDEPGEYIQDTLLLKWGLYEPQPDVVFFGGATENTVVGLGGSVRHVIGNLGVGVSNARVNFVAPYLDLPKYLLNFLAKDINLDPDAYSWRAFCAENQNVLDKVFATSNIMDGSAQRLEFLAKRLLHGQWTATNRRVLLATPIYVAMAD
jgi:hypothetical protein